MKKSSKREPWKTMTFATALAAAITATPALAENYTISGDVSYSASQFDSSTAYTMKATADATATFNEACSVSSLQVYYSGSTLYGLTFAGSKDSYGITTTSDFTVGGGNGSGHLTINSGTYSTSSSGKLLVGYYTDNARTGYLALKGGSLSVGNETRLGGNGNGSTGTLVVDGGTFSASSSMSLGYGSSDSGYLYVSNGTATVTGNITLGKESNSAGYIEVANKGSLSTGTILAGNASGAKGYVNLSGGTFANSCLRLGNGSGGYGCLTLTDSGAFTVTATDAKNFAVGYSSGAEGRVEIYGGTLTMNSVNCQIPYDSGATGTILVNGGTLNTGDKNLTLGNGSGVGTLVISNGTASVNAILMPGTSGSDVVEVSGGSLSVGAVRLGSGSGASGKLVLNGGEMTVTSDNTIHVGYSSGGTGCLELNGGILKVYKAIAKKDGSGTITFNGGILAPLSAMSFSLTDITSTIAEGGMIVSNDVAVTINMANFSAASGVTPTLTKKGTGTLTLSNVSSDLGLEIVVEDGSVAFSDTSYVPASLTYSGDSSFTVSDTKAFAAITNVISIADEKTVTATVGSYFTVALTANMLASGDWREHVTALSDVNVWTGGETGTLNGGTSTSLLVTNEVVLTIAGNHNLDGGCFLYDVTFKQTSGYLNQYGTFTGPGRIIYDGSEKMVVIRNASGTANIYNDVVFTGGTSKLATHRDKTTKFFGAVSGSGKIYAQQYDTNNTNKGYNIFAGDMSGFTGEIETAFNNSNYYIQFTDAATNLVNATVKLDPTGNGTALCATAGTYTFGSLSGKVTGGSEDVTIVTGSGDTQATNIAYTAGTGSWTLTKKGSQQLTVTGADFASYVLDGGTLVTFGEQTIGTTITTSVAGKQVVKADGSYTYSLEDTSTDVTVDGITIPSAWITDKGLEDVATAQGVTVAELLASGSTVKATNDYNYFACYALGLTPTDEDSTPKVTISTDSNGNFVVGLDGCTLADGVSVDLKLLSSTDVTGTFTEKETTGDGTGTSETFTITPSSETTLEFFKVAIDISAASN